MRNEIVRPARSMWFVVVVALGLLALLAALLAVTLWVMARPSSTGPGRQPGPITLQRTGPGALHARSRGRFKP